MTAKIKNLRYLLPSLRDIDRSVMTVRDQAALQTAIESIESHAQECEALDLLRHIDNTIDAAFSRNIGRAIPLSKQSAVQISKSLQNFVNIVEGVPKLDWRDNRGRRLKDNEHYVGLYVLAHQIKHVAEDPEVFDLPTGDS